MRVDDTFGGASGGRMRHLFPALVAAIMSACMSGAAIAQTSPPDISLFPNVQALPLEVVTHEQAQARISARTDVANAVIPPLGAGTLKLSSAPVLSGKSGKLGGVQTQSLALATPADEISELSRALKWDPDLIYEFVHNNIETEAIYGSLKGAIGAMTDRRGTAFDQAELMVLLLQDAALHNPAVANPQYRFGQIWLTREQLMNWLGTDDKFQSNTSALQVGSFPHTIVQAAGGVARCARIDWVWVQVTIGGTTVEFDPAAKLSNQALADLQSQQTLCGADTAQPLSQAYIRKPGVDLAAATGYDEANFLTRARTGATITDRTVAGINRANVRADLATMSSALVSWIRTNQPSATTADIVGGTEVKPVPIGLQQRWTTLPYACTSPCAAPTSSTTIASGYRATLRVTLPGASAITFNTADIYGRRLTVFPNGSNQPVLRLDGTIQATGSAITPGANLAIGVQIVLPNATTTTRTLNTPAGQPVVIGSGWGWVSRGMIERHRRILVENQLANTDPVSEPVLGESLSILSYTWLAQVSESQRLLGSAAKVHFAARQSVGLAGYRSGSSSSSPFVDLPINLAGLSQRVARPAVSGFTPAESSAFFTSAMMMSILESGSLQQTNPGSVAASTVKLLDTASQTDTLYDINNGATSGNDAAYWTSTFKPAMTPYYSAGDISAINTAVGGGVRVVAALHGSQSVGQWTGSGYFQITQNGQNIGGIISGGLSGGFGGTNIPTPSYNSNLGTFQMPPIKSIWNAAGGLNWTGSDVIAGDPVGMTNGAFLYENPDLVVGSGAFPYSLTFSRRYDSNRRLVAGSMGRGWSHSFDYSVAKDSDGFATLGLESPISGASAIAMLYTTQDLLNLADGSKPLDRLVISVQAASWLMDQMLDNVVNVSQPGAGDQFVKLADGSYKEGHGSTAKLSLSGGLYTYTTLGGDVLSFNSAGKASTYQLRNGPLVTFAYDGSNKLTSVTNGMGRTLTLSYTGELVTGVTDGTRSWVYTYDASKNLTSAKNPNNDSITYAYDQPGRMTKIFYPSNPTIAFVDNTYSVLDRVNSQLDANGNPTTFFIAGSRGEVRNAQNAATVHYFNRRGLEVAVIDALGNRTSTDYDGLNRRVRTTWPEGNRVDLTYDNTYSASAVRLQNVLSAVRTPKPGSSLTPITTSSTYDATCVHQVKTSTDGTGAVTTFSYNPSSCNLTQVEAPLVGGQAAIATLTYNTRGQVLTITDPTGKVTRSTYDTASEKRLSVIEDDGRLNLTMQYGYDAVGNVTSVTDPRGNVTTITFDGMRRPLVTTGPTSTGIVTKLTYNPDGLITKAERATGLATSPWATATATYTPSGMRLTTVDENGHTTAYTYDSLDRLTTETDPAGRVTTTAYDALGRVASISNLAIQSTPLVTNTYSANGRVSTFKDANGNLTTYAYDGFDRAAKTLYPVVTRGVGVSDPANYEAILAYDNADRPLQTRKRSGDIVTLVYDARGRLTSKQFSDHVGDVHFGYDAADRPLFARYGSTAGVGVDYTYDTAGRVSSETTSQAGFNKAVTYAYDEAGNRTRVTWPDGFYAGYVYNAANRVIAVNENGATSGLGFLAAYAYDPLGRVTSITRGNGRSTGAGYDPVGNLTSLNQSSATASAAQNLSLDLSYSAANQLIARQSSNALYDWVSSSTGATEATADGLNRDAAIAALPGGYDANGNQTSDGARTFAYGRENELTNVTISASQKAVSLAYDPGGRLQLQQITIGAASAVTTRYLYGGQDLLAEYDGSGLLLRRYVHGPGRDEPLVWYEGGGTTDRRWLLADERGSVIAESDASGTVIQTYSYGPYGEPSAWGGSRFSYTGQIAIPEAQLHHYKARAYDPMAGRFLQVDPIGYAGGQNLYAYVDGDPLNRADPTGKSYAPGGANYDPNWGSLRIWSGRNPPADSFQVAANSSRGDWFDRVKNLVDAIPVIGGILTGQVPDPPKVTDVPEKAAPQGPKAPQPGYEGNSRPGPNPPPSPGSNPPKVIVPRPQPPKTDPPKFQIPEWIYNGRELENGLWWIPGSQPTGVTPPLAPPPAIVPLITW